MCGNTIEFNRIFSDGTVTQHPKMVMDGFSFPSLLNNEGFSILAKGLFGSGSLGVPSTRAQQPMVELRPTKRIQDSIWKTKNKPFIKYNIVQLIVKHLPMLCKINVWSLIMAFSNTIDSRIRTPGPICTPAPIDTFGPSCRIEYHCLFQIYRY